MKSDIRILLDEEDFKSLVSGGILIVEAKEANILIALRDIGFIKMYETIDLFAEEKEEPYQNRTRINGMDQC
jgi:hypothetical protein